MKRFLAALLVLTLFISICGCKSDEEADNVSTAEKEYPDYVVQTENPKFTDNNVFDIDVSKKYKELNSLYNNINLWYAGVPGTSEKYDVYDFTDYVQLMQCSGGAETRDLFKDPLDTTVLDDYDFTKLINACRGIIEHGAKPFLKLGGVPLKYSKETANGDFSMNVYPPDDYNVYYEYIRALTQALVDEFGKDEVLLWRFGVMTEFENKGWFMHPSGDPEQTKIAYFKLYDYTVQALIDVLGDKVFVGAHAMACSEGMWDAADFIKHAAQGTNYANGKKGSHICYLAASWYQAKAGQKQVDTSKTFIDTMNYLKENAQKYGLDDLIYGVDEGRILSGSIKGTQRSDLNNRMVGYTYQAAFDAKLYKEAMDMGVSYFSSWQFVIHDIPTVSYHIAKNTADFKGMNRVQVLHKEESNFRMDWETKTIAAYDEQSKTLRIMAYNYQETLNKVQELPLLLNIKAPQKSGKVTITTKYVNDDCNYFDEWLEDKETYNISNDMFRWSPDDPGIQVFLETADDELKNIYYEKMLPRYREAATLVPKQSTAEIKDGKLTINDTIDGNSVVFYEIKF